MQGSPAEITYGANARVHDRQQNWSHKRHEAASASPACARSVLTRAASTDRAAASSGSLSAWLAAMATAIARLRFFFEAAAEAGGLAGGLAISADMCPPSSEREGRFAQWYFARCSMFWSSLVDEPMPHTGLAFRVESTRWAPKEGAWAWP